MRFFLDANLPRSALDVVMRFGHEAEFAPDTRFNTASDVEIAAHLHDSGAALITRDLDFADIRQYPTDQHAGIVVLRMPDDSVARDIANVLERFLSESRFVGGLAGRLAIVEPDRVRFRPKL